MVPSDPAQRPPGPGSLRPHRGPLFVALTSTCNFRCWFCTSHGENRSAGSPLPTPELTTLIAEAYREGVRTFRFTGGEPTLRSDVAEVLEATQALGPDVRIALTTNGARLRRLVPTLAKLVEPRVFVSVDGLSRITGPEHQGRRAPARVLTKALKATIDEVAQVADVRLNFVLTTSTRTQLEPLLEYVLADGHSLKIFELLLRDFHYEDGPVDAAFSQEYCSVLPIAAAFARRYGKPKRFVGTGGRGMPMWAFKVDRSRIVFFDSLGGSHYGDACRSCARFPCQEGLYAPILDADGTLHPAGCENPELMYAFADTGVDGFRSALATLESAIGASRLLPAVPEMLQEAR
jgi:molybdenum cofactor biosynthesis enzyme MoaA